MKALIFDMGGVLIDLDLEACKQAYRKLGFSEVDSVLDLCHQKGIFGQMEEGLVSADDFRNYILERSNPGVTVEQIDDALCHILVGIAPYKIELLHRLAAQYDIYMLSNNNPIAMKRSGQMFKEAGFGLYTHFKKCYISCDMKALKPSEDFYKRVMEDIGLPSSEMLFIDDSQLNVDAAISAGLPAIYYKPGTDLDKLITDYLDTVA
jgi:putative hydrolase of the HAD superfamily